MHPYLSPQKSFQFSASRGFRKFWPGGKHKRDWARELLADAPGSAAPKAACPATGAKESPGRGKSQLLPAAPRTTRSASPGPRLLAGAPGRRGHNSREGTGELVGLLEESWLLEAPQRNFREVRQASCGAAPTPQARPSPPPPAPGKSLRGGAATCPAGFEVCARPGPPSGRRPASFSARLGPRFPVSSDRPMPRCVSRHRHLDARDSRGCPSIEECLNKMWYMIVMEYHCATRKDEQNAFRKKPEKSYMN
ncbi:uncharacterized protein LOC144455446 [Phascolarctos cinereus]